jgi:putative endonuclease
MQPPEDPWFVYLLECADGSLYTGIARDVEKRLALHNQGKGAKYTRGRRPLVLLARSGAMSRTEALRLELRVKRLPREAKRSAVDAGQEPRDAPAP